jgi:hypothetical protein
VNHLNKAIDDNKELFLTLVNLLQTAKPYTNEDICTDPKRSYANMLFFEMAYELISKIENSMSDTCIVKIKQLEDSYEVWTNNQVWYTGDLENDFSVAVAYAHANFPIVMYSSTVDEFVAEHSNEYYFDEDSLIRRR